ncbi:MAG: hypothetical protein M1822_006287 [Bathelium mastoideum]|nr:MAG: hypothetical protein M1822_006287 [Bathelium mastoideum]
MPLPRNLRFPILNAHPIPVARARTPLRPFSHRAAALASSDYGSGAGDPKGENPQQQGPNPSADKEHPGPPPPAAGQGSGSTPTKGTAEGHNTTGTSSSSLQQDKAGGGQKRSFMTSARRGAEDSGELRSQGTRGAQPKILKDAPPAKGEESEEVKRHNEEMDRRHEKAHAKVTEADPEKEKVGKGFWSGEF